MAIGIRIYSYNSSNVTYKRNTVPNISTTESAGTQLCQGNGSLGPDPSPPSTYPTQVLPSRDVDHIITVMCGV